MFDQVNVDLINFSENSTLGRFGETILKQKCIYQEKIYLSNEAYVITKAKVLKIIPRIRFPSLQLLSFLPQKIKEEEKKFF